LHRAWYGRCAEWTTLSTVAEAAPTNLEL
jgi:hypothetical protein